jgi:hypothetical protein
MSAEAQSADADNDEAESENNERTIYPQVTQHPHSIIVGDEVVDIFTSANLDSGTEKTGTSVGVVWKNPTIAKGNLWKNREVPEGFETGRTYMNVVYAAAGQDDDMDAEEALDRLVDAGVIDSTDVDIEISRSQQGTKAIVNGEDDISVPTVDYKMASGKAGDVQEVGGTVLGIDVGGGVFPSEQVEEFEEDEVLVWYGGIAGQFIMRAFDFNGRPSARYKDDGYLVKGLFQHPLGWFDRDTEDYDVETTNRSKLAKSQDNGGLGRPPRVARPPILREDVAGESVFVEIDHYNGGPMLEATIAFNDFEGDDWEDATQLEPRYEQDPEEVLAATFDEPNEVYALYHGDGWQPEPGNAQPVMGTDQDAESGGGGSFDIGDTDLDDDSVEHPTEQERQFAEMISEKIAGTGATPDEAFASKGGLEGVVGSNTDQFNVTPDVEAIRKVIYENTGHLSTDDIGAGEGGE